MKKRVTGARSLFLKDLAGWFPVLRELALGKGARDRALDREELLAVSRAVRELSRGFTRERSLAGKRYFTEDAFRKAYLLYFWPVSYIQARLVFSRFLPPGTLAGAAVLDLGSGPGPAALAALDAGARRAVAADITRAATALAVKLAAARGKQVTPAAWDGLRNDPPGGRYDLIVMSHVLNELWPADPERVRLRADRLSTISRSLSDSGLLVLIEPALFQTTRDLLALRDLLLKKGFAVVAPCLRQGACPCLSDAQATCHADFDWEPPALLSRIAHGARLGKSRLRFSFLLLGKAGTAIPREEDPGIFRVVSEQMRSKSGRRRYFLCGERGRFTLSAMPDPRMRWNGVFSGLQRYDAVRVDKTETREHGEGLVGESVLEKISAFY